MLEAQDAMNQLRKTINNFQKNSILNARSTQVGADISVYFSCTKAFNEAAKQIKLCL